jgi:hypothetical protein
MPVGAASCEAPGPARGGRSEGRGRGQAIGVVIFDLEGTFVGAKALSARVLVAAITTVEALLRRRDLRVKDDVSVAILAVLEAPKRS